MTAPPIRLLVIVNVYRPDLGGGVLFADLCEGLAEEGIDVTVKCAYSYYPEWTDKSGQNGWHIRSTRENHVTVERHGLYIPGNPNSLLQRLLYEASFYLSLRRRLPAPKSTDVILVICPLVGAVAYASAAKRRTGAPLWINVQDLSAQAAAAGGIAGQGLFGRSLVRVQEWLFRKADYWSSISAPMVRVLEEVRGNSGPVELIPNWMHRSLAEAIDRHRSYRSDESDETVKLLYSGNIGTKQNLISFCTYLHQTDARFNLKIHGDGGRAPELRKWLEHVDDSRFQFSGLTDEEGLARALAETDFYLITEKSGVGSAFIPSKLIPGITSGTPLMAVCDTDSPLGIEMQEHQLGPRLDWSNLDASGPLLQRACILGDEYATWEKNARSRSAYFSRDAGIARCKALILHMMNHHGPTR